MVIYKLNEENETLVHWDTLTNDKVFCIDMDCTNIEQGTYYIWSQIKWYKDCPKVDYYNMSSYSSVNATLDEEVAEEVSQEISGMKKVNDLNTRLWD
jgi:hypothetical protein